MFVSLLVCFGTFVRFVLVSSFMFLRVCLAVLIGLVSRVFLILRFVDVVVLCLVCVCCFAVFSCFIIC